MLFVTFPELYKTDNLLSSIFRIILTYSYTAVSDTLSAKSKCMRKGSNIIVIYG